MTAVRSFIFLVLAWAFAAPAMAADRGKIEAFMQVTGFDVALNSMRVSAKNAPAMLGLDAQDFGLSWTMLADEVFEEAGLQEDALGILENTLREDVLDHAAAFYASDLGQRLVAAENESHFADDDLKREQGQELAAAMMDAGSPQPQYFLEMTDAIGSIDNSIQSYREVQVSFIMAAQAAGILERSFSEAELREILSQNDEETRQAIRANIVSGNAYTYRGFSDEEVLAYLDALRTPQMQEVYELMNAVQYTLMAQRYEILAARMAELHPSQEL